jgi:hypothetical protein
LIESCYVINGDAQLVTSLATIGSAIAVMLFFGPFSALIGAIGLGVFAGFTGALVTILFMAGSCCMCIRCVSSVRYHLPCANASSDSLPLTSL